MKITLAPRIKSLMFFLLLFFAAVPTIHAQGPGESPFLAPARAPIMGSTENGIFFERQGLDFSAQGLYQQSCINVVLYNYTDHPRALTKLTISDPRFTISSPAQQMLPMTIPAFGNFFVTICFQADSSATYLGKLIAQFNSDSAVMHVRGAALDTLARVVPPAKTALTLQGKSYNRTFKIDLHEASMVIVTVENMLGKTVRTFDMKSIRSAGSYQIEFNGLDETGQKLPNGQYVVRLAVHSAADKGDEVKSERLTLK